MTLQKQEDVVQRAGKYCHSSDSKRVVLTRVFIHTAGKDTDLSL